MNIVVYSRAASDYEAVRNHASTSGHTCHYVNRISEWHRLLKSVGCDLLICDVESMRDAPQELTGWRGNSVGRIPVILLCDPSDYTSVAQVDAQFADYLTKPVNPYEAYIRIDGVLRRTYGKPSGSGQIDRDGWGLDPFTWTVWNKDIRLKLPPKEFDIIWTLCNQLGQTVSRAQLLQVAWGRPISPDSRTLESHMTRVRRKLERLFGDDFRMVSVYSKGYRLEILV